MLELYAVKVPEKIPFYQYQFFLDIIDKEKKTIIQRFKYKKDAYRSLISTVLVSYLISEKLSLDLENIQFEHNLFGKPFLKNYSNQFFFNLSHSGDWVICALNEQEVGVDIEEKVPIEYNIAEHIFSHKEYNDLFSKSEDEKMNYFYDIWTLKESYIKAVGKGLEIPLKSFTIRKFNSNNIRLYVNNEITNWNFKQYELDQNYKLSVCTKGNTSTLELYIKELSMIYHKMLKKFSSQKNIY